MRRISFDEIQPVDSIHLPIRQYCEQRRLHTRSVQSLLLINHYIGSYEQYTYREKDARHGLVEVLQEKDVPEYKRKNMNQVRNTQQFYEHQQLKHPLRNTEIVSWIDGFLENDVPPKQYHTQVLQDVGKLDKKSWRTYEGNPMTERCALLFFGLPRGYKTMVLPSIIKNILIPNARHHCDVYVHYYQQYEEAPGRRNRGGNINPDEIFQLETAVQSVFEEYGPKRGSRTDNGQIKPIVSFVHDTSEQFIEKRHDQLQKYQQETSSLGDKLKYFPWSAKTYTTTSLENMVRQWHSIEYVFKLMDYTSKQYNLQYDRVGMFRSDAMYVTPIDIASIDTLNDIMDTSNKYFVTAPFALNPVNDRLIYGPYDAVKIWATKRFELIEERANTQIDPGYTMHSERFMNSSIIPAMEQLGYEHIQNPDICFLRTRADESAIITDCSIAGTVRNWEELPNKVQVVESIVGKKCTFFQMSPKWQFVGCGDSIDYKSGQQSGWK